MVSRRNSSRLGALLILMVLGFVGLWGWLAYLQTFDYDSLKGRRDSQSFIRIPIIAERGKIYDRKGEILALSVPGHSVWVNPAVLDRNSDMKLTAPALASAVGINSDKLLQALTAARAEKLHFLWVKRLVAPAEEAEVRALRLPGVEIRDEPQRYYPGATLACQVIGFAGIDQGGLSGVEFAFDSRLRGTDGYRDEGRDGLARGISSPSSAFLPAVNGQSVVLTIDTNIQDFLETAVDRCNQQYSPASVTGVVMDPNTGDILALAGRPNFDPNRYADYPKDSWRLRAVTDSFEPGSMFKPFVFSGAYQEKLVRLNETIFCGNGIYQIGARTLHDAHPYGDLTAEGIVVKSSNIGMAKIGQRLGAWKMFAYLNGFGFGRPTGLGFPAEAAGRLAPARAWTDYTVTSVPMGHEVSVTAIQVATAFSAIANGGFLLKPRILRGVISSDGHVLEKHAEPEVVCQAINSDIAHTMITEVLRKVVTEGTGRLADIDDYEIAGKTGTAQKLINNVFSHDKYVSSFVCAGPIQDPRLVVLMVVDEPSRGASLYGGTVAAPGCAEVLKSSLDYMYIDGRRRSKSVTVASADAKPAPARRSRGGRNAP